MSEMGNGVLKRVASENKVRRSHGNSGAAELVQGGGKQAGAEAFAKRSQAVIESGINSDGPVRWCFVKQVAAKKFQFVQDLGVFVLGVVMAS
jgi:hypothetical protein